MVLRVMFLFLNVDYQAAKPQADLITVPKVPGSGTISKIFYQKHPYLTYKSGLPTKISVFYNKIYIHYNDIVSRILSVSLFLIGSDLRLYKVISDDRH